MDDGANEGFMKAAASEPELCRVNAFDKGGARLDKVARGDEGWVG